MAVPFREKKQITHSSSETLLDIQIGKKSIFRLSDSAQFISSNNRVRTRIPAFFSNRRKLAFCFGPPLSLSVDDEENEQDDDDDDDDDDDECGAEEERRRVITNHKYGVRGHRV